MHTLKVVNLKCGGCETGVVRALEKLGAAKVSVDVMNQTVTFEGDVDVVTDKLRKMGYPLADSEESKSLMKKAVSYASCLVGKTMALGKETA
jgi:copper chaperone CopZ